jgi:hypothetical protein
MLLKRSTGYIAVIATAVGEIAIAYVYMRYFHSLDYPVWFKFLLITVLLIVLMGTPKTQIIIFRDVIGRNKTDNRIIVYLMLIESWIAAGMILYLVRSHP